MFPESSHPESKVQLQRLLRVAPDCGQSSAWGLNPGWKLSDVMRIRKKRERQFAVSLQAHQQCSGRRRWLQIITPNRRTIESVGAETHEEHHRDHQRQRLPSCASLNCRALHLGIHPRDRPDRKTARNLARTVRVFGG
jgi:hypothetical protein